MAHSKAVTGIELDPVTAFLLFFASRPTVGFGVNHAQVGTFENCITSRVFLDFIEIPKRLAIVA